MRGYSSHESALRTMQVRFEQHRRIEFADLLHYLENVSSEPDGEDAYGLAISIRSMSLSDEQLFDLFINAQQHLSYLFCDKVPNESILGNLADATTILNIHLRKKQTATPHRGIPAEKDNGTREASKQPSSGSAVTEESEVVAARNHGYKIFDSLYYFNKRNLFHQMAALALYWTLVKPSSNSSTEPSLRVEQDAIRMFQ